MNINIIKQLNKEISSSKGFIIEAETTDENPKRYGELGMKNIDEYIEAISEDKITPMSDNTEWEVGYLQGLEKAREIVIKNTT